MKSYIVYHYKENSQKWMDELFNESRFPVFDFVSTNRANAIQKHIELGGCDNGYYVAMVNETDIEELV